MKTAQLVFTGIKGSVVALERPTGRQVWATRLKGGDFVNIMLQAGMLLATCCGEIFCLDPVNGVVKWHNPLKGFGRGLATIATETAGMSGSVLAMAEKRRRDEATASAAAVACAGAA